MRLLTAAVLAASMLAACGSTTPPAPAGIRAPVVLRRVEPEYPAALRGAGARGAVEISGTIPKEGGVLRNARVVRSDDPRLDQLALDAVSRWIWRPGTQDGQAVDVEFTTTVTFSANR